MASDSKDKNSINTGGGAYIGGNVSTQGGDFVGRDKVVTTRRGMTIDEFRSLLADMQALIPQAGLEERKARTIEADVVAVEEESKESSPDKSIIVTKLESITKILKAAGNLTDAGKKLLPLAEKALQWAGLFI